MNIVPWKNKTKELRVSVPSPVSALCSEMDALFNRFFSQPWGLTHELFGPAAWSGAWTP